MEHKELMASLLALLKEGGEGIPINVKISPSDEITALRLEKEALEAEVIQLKEKLKQCERYLADEMAISNRVVQLLRDNNIPIPKNFFRFR